ncbi:hypothetical protein F5Y03DRAFT_338531 [Xylaria venustula]|nr:hypothetical protein F5Y03DRAFT_338531 [Xylaria venustula]
MLATKRQQIKAATSSAVPGITPRSISKVSKTLPKSTRIATRLNSMKVLHRTISKDNTADENRRKSASLAFLGSKLKRNTSTLSASKAFNEPDSWEQIAKSAVSNLTHEQFRARSTLLQAKSIQTYSQNLQQHHGHQIPNKQAISPDGPQGQGSFMTAYGPEDTVALAAFYPEIYPGGIQLGPGATQGVGSNNALLNYQIQIALLEQQQKKRNIMMARRK